MPAEEIIRERREGRGAIHCHCRRKRSGGGAVRGERPGERAAGASATRGIDETPATELTINPWTCPRFKRARLQSRAPSNTCSYPDSYSYLNAYSYHKDNHARFFRRPETNSYLWRVARLRRQLQSCAHGMGEPAT